MRKQPLIVGIIIAGVGYVLKYFNLVQNVNIAYGVMGLGVLLIVGGLLMKPSYRY